MNLELDLVAEAREILGTRGITDTVHEALREVVRREKLRRLTEEPFDGLTREEEERLDWGLPLDGSPEPR